MRRKYGRMVQYITRLIAMPKVRGPTVRSCVSWKAFRYGYELHIFTGEPKSTQPSTLCGTLKWISISFRVQSSDDDEWMTCGSAATRCCSYLFTYLFTYLLTYLLTYLVCGLAVAKRRSSFIKWTEWTLSMTFSQSQHHKHCHLLLPAEAQACRYCFYSVVQDWQKHG